ncbi:MAG: hypothetical protein ABI560_09925, partial [Myxococcales bacterium]
MSTFSVRKQCTLLTAGLIVATVLTTGAAEAAKPEDVFKGKIFITKNRLPDRFPSSGAFISAVQSK